MSLKGYQAAGSAAHAAKEVARARWGARALFLLGGVTLAGSGYVFYKVWRQESAGAEGGDAALPLLGRKETFDRLSTTYDKAIEFDEALFFIRYLRRRLLSKADRGGRVLEVSAGTGRNLPYFSGLGPVVLSDISPAMLDEARAKLQRLRDQSRYAGLPQVSFVTADAHKLPFEDDSFQTVVDTFGLCSFDDPDAVLRELCRVCAPTGKILLLEHGRSPTWDWLNKRLDASAPAHRRQWGCTWNLDIGSIVRRCDQLSIVHESRHHLGTTAMIVARPTKQQQKKTLLNDPK